MTPFNNDGRTRVAVVGGGAAGMMSAIYAACGGADVVIFERNDTLGRKLRITGKGRCNVTNQCDINEFLNNVPTNPRFLYAALNNFSTADTMNFFEECGVKLKVERGRRVFPVSDKARDIVNALINKCREVGVCVVNKRVSGLNIVGGRVQGVNVSGECFECDSVIICTGGKSYPGTGSDGDGYKFAKDAGHTVTKLSPSLVPIVADTSVCAKMQGLSLKNVTLKIVNLQNNKMVFEEFGEMMFTHFGLTGPIVLSASAHISDISRGKYKAVVDLKPALDESVLDARLLSDFSKYQNKDFINALGDLLPLKAIEPIIEKSGIDKRKKVNSITKEERKSLIAAIKSFDIPLLGFRPIDEAIVTKGGVAVNEVSPKTMESKLVGGLFFAGEVLDLDAYTGGYNLQIAFSTATVAGANAALI